MSGTKELLLQTYPNYPYDHPDGQTRSMTMARAATTTRAAASTRLEHMAQAAAEPLPGDPPTGNLPAVTPARIPYMPLLNERFGIDQSGWRALIDAIFPNARSFDSVLLALSYCKARGLDPFKRPCHIVSTWNREQGRYVDGIWAGIGELRTTASRTGSYAGYDECVFGPEREETFVGNVGKNENARHVSVRVKYPEWAQITVYRMVQGHRAAFPGPKVFWTETYAVMGKSDVPNEMWQTRPYGQLEKCAEAAALRRAFPEEVGDDHIVEEAEPPMREINPPPPTATRPTRAETAGRPGDPPPMQRADPDAEYRQALTGRVPDLPTSDPSFDKVDPEPTPDRTTPQGHMPPIQESLKRREEPAPSQAVPATELPFAATPAADAVEEPQTLKVRRKGTSYDFGSFCEVMLDKLTYCATAEHFNEWLKLHNFVLGPMHRENPPMYTEFGQQVARLRDTRFNVPQGR